VRNLASFSVPEPAWIGRRESVRFPADDEAQIEVAADPPFTLTVLLRDASQRGLRLALPRAVSRGDQVRITIAGSPPLAGEVRYCRAAGAVYYAGVVLYVP
jgi:protein involved in polysaccharide export with SLBB domain